MYIEKAIEILKQIDAEDLSDSCNQVDDELEAIQIVLQSVKEQESKIEELENKLQEKDIIIDKQDKIIDEMAEEIFIYRAYSIRKSDDMNRLKKEIIEEYRKKVEEEK